MNIILFTTARGTPGSLNLSRPKIYLPLLGMLALMSGLLVYAGYQLGGATPVVAVTPTAQLPSLRADLAKQQDLVAQVRRRSQSELDSLMMRMTQIQAQVMRIEGLGKRLVDLADLDHEEFNFAHPPAQGGPVEATVALESSATTTTTSEFMQELDQLSNQIKDRERQLIVLEDAFQGHGLFLHGRPAGSPVSEGWLSSFFGIRNDPFTGRAAMHKGLDFAGKAGSPVVAVAAGAVSWSGPRDGYGNLVEIDHGHGYVTRYGHNQRNLVRVGQLVRKGQQIAKMGSSGRSTGPHVHFEVLDNGQPVNPLRYLSANR